MIGEEVSIIKFINDNHLINEKRIPIGFKDHFFLYDVYRDFSPDIVLKKSAQVGVSVMMILKSLYLAKIRKTNVIYTLPTDSDMQEFVPTKVDKIIIMNPALKEMLQRDTLHLKELNETFIYFKGTVSKSAAIMTTAELLIHDELDRSDQGVVSGFQSRTIGYKGEGKVFTGRWTLSNPSVVNSGVDLEWKRSDQKEWFIRCEKCKYIQTLKWSKNVDIYKGIFVCAGCGKELVPEERQLGVWVPQKTGMRISGYHISQMMAPWMSAKDLLKEAEDMTPDVFENFVLGEPVSLGTADNFRRLIIDCWTPKSLDKPPYIMGVDIGKIKHWVLGSQDGIFKIGRCESREEVESIIDKYNPIVVMDAGPERTWAEEFRRKYPRLTICFYKKDKDKKIMVKWGEEEDAGIVWADKSRTIDAVIEDIARGEIQYDLEARDIDAYIKHWDCMVKRREENALGVDIYEWTTNREGAPDHWMAATVYYWIARSRAKEAKVVSGIPERKPFIAQKQDGGFVMADLEKNFDELVKKRP